MNIKHILNKHRLEAFVVLFLIVIAVLYFTNGTRAQTPIYTRGETLNPTCLSSDPNCTIAFFETKDESSSLTTDTLSFDFKGDGVKATTNSSGDVTVEISGDGTPAGSNTQIQYNNGGTFGATSDFRWDNSISGLGIGSVGSIEAALHVKSGVDTDAVRIQNSIEQNVMTIGYEDNPKVSIGKYIPTAALDIKNLDSNLNNYALKVDDSSDSPLLYVRNDGNVGIGTDNPQTTLTVEGQLRVQSGSGAQIDSISTATYGQIGTGTAHDLRIMAGNNPAITIDNSSRDVGIGTVSPARALHISDVMRLEPITSPGGVPSFPGTGDIIVYDASAIAPFAFCFYNGASWVNVAPVLGAACP